MLFKLKLINFSLLTTTVCTFAMQSPSVPFPSYRKTKNFSPYLILAEKVEELTQYIDQRKTEQTTFYVLHTQCDNFSASQEQLKHKLEAFLKKIEDDEQAFLTLKEEHQKKLEEHTKKYDALYLKLTEKIDVIEKSILQLTQPSIEEFEALKSQIKTLATQTKSEKVKIAELEETLTVLTYKANKWSQHTTLKTSLIGQEKKLNQLKAELEDAQHQTMQIIQRHQEENDAAKIMIKMHSTKTESALHELNLLKSRLKKMKAQTKSRACQTDASELIEKTSPPQDLPQTHTEKAHNDILSKAFSNTFLQKSYFFRDFISNNPVFHEELSTYITNIQTLDLNNSLAFLIERDESIGRNVILQIIPILRNGIHEPHKYPSLNTKYAQFLIYTWINLRHDSSLTLLEVLNECTLPENEANFRDFIIFSFFKILRSIAQTLSSNQVKIVFFENLIKSISEKKIFTSANKYIFKVQTSTVIIDLLEYLSNNFKLNPAYKKRFMDIYCHILSTRAEKSIIESSEYSRLVAPEYNKLPNYMFHFVINNIMIKKKKFTQTDKEIILDTIKLYASINTLNRLSSIFPFLKKTITQKTFNIQNISTIFELLNLINAHFSKNLIRYIEESASPEEKANFSVISELLKRHDLSH
ncbi:MAG: hypothetical protein HEEMFOPI_01097 [Holosporales bacterium]